MHNKENTTTKSDYEHTTLINHQLPHQFQHRCQRIASHRQYTSFSWNNDHNSDLKIYSNFNKILVPLPYLPGFTTVINTEIIFTDYVLIKYERPRSLMLLISLLKHPITSRRHHIITLNLKSKYLAIIDPNNYHRNLHRLLIAYGSNQKLVRE